MVATEMGFVESPTDGETPRTIWETERNASRPDIHDDVDSNNYSGSDARRFSDS
jgi:hypothetical protein